MLAFTRGPGAAGSLVHTAVGEGSCTLLHCLFRIYLRNDARKAITPLRRSAKFPRWLLQIN